MATARAKPQHMRATWSSQHLQDRRNDHYYGFDQIQNKTCANRLFRCWTCDTKARKQGCTVTRLTRVINTTRLPTLQKSPTIVEECMHGICVGLPRSVSQLSLYIPMITRTWTIIGANGHHLRVDLCWNNAKTTQKRIAQQDES